MTVWLVLLGLLAGSGGAPTQPQTSMPEKDPYLDPIRPEPGFAATAGTHCRRGEQVIYSCDLSGRRRVSVCRDQRTVLYRFGPAGRPELELGRSAPPVTRGFRSYFAYEYRLRFPNGAYSYAIYDKSDQKGDGSGVVVWRKGKLLARYACPRYGPMQKLSPNRVADMADDPDPLYDSWSIPPPP